MQNIQAINNQQTSSEQDDAALVDEVMERARIAQQKFEATGSQELYDKAALAIGWAIMEPSRNQELADLAVKTTGLGNVADKIKKNHRKTLGVLRDIQKSKTCGIISDNKETGIIEIARPVGVVGAVVPSTNPVATPANNAINAIKCGNAIVLSPSPKGNEACQKLISYIHAEFDKVGLDKDLVQMVPAPSSKIKTQRLMETADILVVTGSQDNVRRAYSSGTPAIGVGAGNVTVIVDETANLEEAAQKIAASKTFDNATSCSSENSIIILDEIYEDFIEAITQAGGRLLQDEQDKSVKQTLFGGGHLNRHMLAKDIDVILGITKVDVEEPEKARFLIISGEGIGAEYPESGEKLSLVVTLYRAKNFDDAKDIASQILSHQGAGHSIGIHTNKDERAIELGQKMPACRIIVNQAHCFATGGSFDNGMPFSLSMGCGSWGGNSIDDNFNHQHLMNITKVVRPIPAKEPSLDQIYGDYWNEAGK